MGTPGQDLITNGGIADGDNARWNRAGIPVEGNPDLISRADPPDSYDGAKLINTPDQVDLVVSKRDKTRVSIKYTAY